MADDQGRRAFLRLAAAGGAGLLSACSPGGKASGPGATAAGASRSAGSATATADGVARAAVPAATRSPSPADWTALGHGLSGPLVRPGEAAPTVPQPPFHP